MIRTLMLTLACLFCAEVLRGQEYPLGPDSQPQEGVPRGEIHGPFSFECLTFPGTVRDYWIYVPEQYDASDPACLIVVQDGLNRANGWNLTTVMDNLIHSGEMPTTIGVFVSPGIVPPPAEDAQPRFNRSFEYDSMTSRYSTFLIEELLPTVEAQYAISQDPNDRAIAGASSGGICAFAVAWHRPNSFRRVISTIGTYVGLRGGDEFATLVRKTEPKPLRIFLQDGSNDLNLYAGDWWIANQQMLSAFEFSGYDVRHEWSEGGHDSKHSAMIMPDALRWLWRDYPEPIRPLEGIERRMDILIDDQPWELVCDEQLILGGIDCDESGRLYLADQLFGKILRITPDGDLEEFATDLEAIHGMRFGPGNQIYVNQKTGSSSSFERIIAIDGSGEVSVPVDNIDSLMLATNRDGLYWLDLNSPAVRFASGERRSSVFPLPMQFENPTGVVVSADQSQLFVADARHRFIYAFQIADPGELRHGQMYGYLHVSPESNHSGAFDMVTDSEGRLYVASDIGVQILDQLGRVHLILPLPNENGADSSCTFLAIGGENHDELFASKGHRIYRRRLNIKGVHSWQDPVTPPRPRL